METVVNHQKNQKSKWVPYLLASFIITNILFFIDEGFYDFRWMKSFGNWLVFAIYFAVIFGVQLLFLRIFSKFFTLRRNIFWIILTETIIALILLFNIFK